MAEMTLAELLEQLKSPDAKVRAAAWQKAGQVGPAALRPLAEATGDMQTEPGRSAGRAMWQVVRGVGRRGAEGPRAAAVKELVAVVGDAGIPAQTRRNAVWMLSEIIKDGEIDTDAAVEALADRELQEDVRAGLLRVDGPKSRAALQKAFEGASGEFKAALGCALRAKGVEVAEPACPKLKAVK